MTSEKPNQPSFLEWIMRPQVLVGLSALLLSVCGLFISIYEMSLIRQAQRASVWPHVEVAVSIRQEGIKLWVQNTGVGPARIQAAAITYKGETQADWQDLILSLVGEEAASVSTYQSMINGRVLPSSSSREKIFGLTKDSGAVEREVIGRLRRAILEGLVDVTVCYCSVFDECWTSSLQDTVGRLRGITSSGSGEVDDCDSIKRSGI